MIVFDSPMLTEICRCIPGKTGPEGMWLPAWRHMLDTGMVMQRLLAQWVPTAEEIQMQGALSAEEWEQVAVLAALLHDVGKLTPLFVSGLLPLLPDVELRLASYGLTVPKKMDDKAPHGFLGALWLRQQDCPHSLAAVVAAHHGKPADLKTGECLRKGAVSLFPTHLYGQNGRDGQMAKLWEAAREAWLTYALQCCGFGSLSDVPEISKSSQMLLSGLLIMADWIASNTTIFPLLAPDEEPGAQVSAKRAEAAMEALHLPGPLYCDRPIANPGEFQKRFSLPALPYPMQQAALQIAQDTISPGLMIVEAQMGTGKTEAALAAAEQFLQKTGAGGVFFGLPTQATANGIFPRLLDWAKQLSPDYQQAIRLAHGMANMNEVYQSLPHGYAPSDEDAVVVHSWMEGRKKALLANFVIGTVDQLLLAALKQKHVMLRHLGLAGKVVIIDECHAYDAYMYVYLTRALRWLGTYHVPVILLSATLPAARRCELMEAYLGKKVSGPWQTSREYPLITWSDGDKVRTQTVPQKGNSTAVQIIRDQRCNVPGLLRQQLVQGGCAVVILNTVREAQQMAQLLRHELPEHNVMLVHAQYLLEDRAEWEKTLLRRLGKRSEPNDRNRLVVVATQVVEQSLDIDCDLLITQLCPMDLLLQRIGRLHRHQRTRPQPLQKATCIVLEPDEGTQAIYGDWLLQQTDRLLPEEILLPDSIPGLVQETYAEPSEEAKKDPAWEKHNQRLSGQKASAKTFVLNACRESKRPELNTLNGMLDADIQDTERNGNAAVRDGAPGIEVLMLVLHPNGEIGLVPWHDGGRRFSAARTPDDEQALCIARQRIRLPHALCLNERETISALEKSTAHFVPEWQHAPLLKGELFLLLDENLQARLGQWALAYHPQDGLQYRKEDGGGAEQ